MCNVVSLALICAIVSRSVVDTGARHTQKIRQSDRNDARWMNNLCGCGNVAVIAIDNQCRTTMPDSNSSDYGKLVHSAIATGTALWETQEA